MESKFLLKFVDFESLEQLMSCCVWKFYHW